MNELYDYDVGIKRFCGKNHEKWLFKKIGDENECSRWTFLH